MQTHERISRGPAKWRIPPNTRLNFKLSRKTGPDAWKYDVVDSTLSAPKRAVPVEKPGERFAPDLQLLRSRIDAVLAQTSALSNPEPIHAGGVGKLHTGDESDRLSSYGADNPAKLKSSLFRQRTFKTLAVRTSTQRRVRFLPETRVDEYVIESSSSEEEADELPVLLSTKSKLRFGSVAAALAPGAEGKESLESAWGEKATRSSEIELIKSGESRSAFHTPTEAGACHHKQEQGNSELKSSSWGESRDENSSRHAEKPIGTSCNSKTNERRYGDLPVNLKRPELVSSVETSNKRFRRNPDQTDPAAGNASPGPAFDPNRSERTSRTGVATFFESPSRPQRSSVFVDSLVHDSQEENEVQDFPVFETVPEDAAPSDYGENYHRWPDKNLFRTERSHELKRVHQENCPERGSVETKGSGDAEMYQREDAVVGTSVQEMEGPESPATCAANLRGGHLRPQTIDRRETCIRIQPNDKYIACIKPPQGSGQDLQSNVFRTGRGNPVQLSPSAMNRVMSLFADDSVDAAKRTESSSSPKWMHRAKSLVVSSTPVDAQSLFTLRKNLYSHSLSVPEGDGSKILDVNVNNGAPARDNAASLFQTASGKPVNIVPENVRRVEPILASSETSSTGEDGTVIPRSKRQSKSVLKHQTVSNGQSFRPVSERDEPSTSGGDDVHNGFTIEESAACLFQTGRGKPVNISSESMRRVQSIFAPPETSPTDEADRVLAPSGRQVNHVLKRQSPSRGQSFCPVSAGEEVSTSGRDQVSNRNFLKAGTTRTGAGQSSLFRTGRNTPVSISSAALQRIRTIFEDDELQIDAGDSSSGSNLSSSARKSSEGGNFSSELERIFYPRLRSNRESGAIYGSYHSVDEAGQCIQTLGEEGAMNVTFGANPGQSEFREKSSPKATDWSFSFKGSSGRTLRVSRASRAKAEALLKLGPEFVTPPKPQVRRPSVELSAKSSELPRPRLDEKGSEHSTLGNQEARKQLNNYLSRKVPRTNSEGERGTKVGFKSPRMIRPNKTGLQDGRNHCCLQSARESTPKLSYLLPVSLHYLHDKVSRSERGRLSVLEYFGGPPCPQTKSLSGLSEEVLSLTADTAETYRVPFGGSGLGVEDIWLMLKDMGADQRYANQGWVANHFRWIVWKLASYERNFPDQAAGLLTLSSVLNELKYRYDRELNGERSALKRVTERDASAGHTMILCVSAIRTVMDMDRLDDIWAEKGDMVDGTKRKPSSAGVIEVTDGWYRLNARIDVPFARRIHSGKLKAGQKIVVCGATLEGLSEGLPPLQAFQDAYLCFNSNGVRRARWDQRLGFCGTATPLAFSCIIPDGGLVPHTYVAITRRYPILHREKLTGGGYILRSDRAEDRTAQDFDQRRAIVAEEAMQKVECRLHKEDEGAKLFASLETAADPESLLADMTRAQLDAFAAYKTRREETMQTATGEVIQAALESRGLATREVTPTFRVRVVGLTPVGETSSHKDGLVTIWHATEELKEQLQEGKVFCVYGLRPTSKGSYHSFNSTRWRPVSGSDLENKYSFPYIPRAPLRISSLSEYMPCREFDVVGLVLFVTDPVPRDSFRGAAKSQWVFITDGSCAKGDAADAWEETQVLAVEVFWPVEAFVPVESSLVGSVVGFCNLWLKHRDHGNRLWVSEASDRANYSTKLTSPTFRHLSSTACEVRKWASLNSWNVDILQSDVEELAVHFKCSANF
ncbi:hypothetical protein R1flu_000079 [Riccia fluitans]|uniref:Breast cancer type 2 susceptibility protein n=1 Tax=Riccia fluitans TaxID=41844 RepID=A0ABD1XZE9_9MARC